jgi:hypothetical protein
MPNALGFAILILFGSVYTVATVAWLAAAYCLLKTIANRRPEVLLWSAPLGFFPPNIVFRPDLLTDRGRYFRRRFGQAGFVFAAAVATGLVLHGLVRMLF